MDDEDCGCPFCDGSDVPVEIIEKIRTAAAAPPSRSMNLEEFREWLDALEPAVRQA